MRMKVLIFLMGIVILGGIGYLTYRSIDGKINQPVWSVPDGVARQGRQASLKYGCYACHVIEGIRRATGRVGPKLEDIDEQIYVGGVLPNSPDNMIRWIQDPKRFSPETAMPDLDVSEQDARNIAAYLYGQS